MMVRPEAVAGRLEGNPVRIDLEEGAAMLGVDFILNVLVDGQKRIVGAVAGDATAAHRKGCEMVAQRATVPIPRQAGVVVVSAGGYPKDVNLYQAQKALDNAGHAVKNGGVIVLLAECAEGMGDRTFELWMRDACSPDDVLARIEREFVLGGHKAAAVAAVLKRAQIFLVSSLREESVRSCGMRPFRDLQAAVDAAVDAQGAGTEVLVMPQGGSVLPVVEA
jgi:nickel-dependent lactate racemase